MLLHFASLQRNVQRNMSYTTAFCLL